MADSVAEAVPDAPRLKRKSGFLARPLRRPADLSIRWPGALDAYLNGPLAAQLRGLTAIRKVSMKQFEVVPEVTALTRGPVEAAGTSNAYSASRVIWRGDLDGSQALSALGSVWQKPSRSPERPAPHFIPKLSL